MKQFLLLAVLFLLGYSYQTNAQVSHTINSGNFFYDPSSLTIDVGDTVVWTNSEGFHDVNFNTNTQTGQSFGNPESFASTATSDSVLYTHVFTIPGDYSYDCSVGSHAANGMVGTITVNADTTTTSVQKMTNNVVENLKVYTINASSSIQLDFQLENVPSTAIMTIYSLDGKALQVNQIGATVGANSHNVSLENIPSKAVYVVVLVVDNQRVIRKIAL
ncbi:MAG: plastocyanin/azurin family copper-binding protein [Saprospiraceae bacterium]|nr:plastocyanin/azurin family copper-binding protein [Saprospiraceae bacterium]